MKNNNINFRVTGEMKNKLTDESKKLNMNVSEYVSRTMEEKINMTRLTESQEEFSKVYEVIFKKVYDPYFKQFMVVLNRINFNLDWQIRTQNLFMKHLKIPQNKDDIHTSFVDHPILDIAKEEVLKDIRTLKQKKADLENGIE